MGDDETLCIPNDSVMHLIENEHIPACLHELDYIKGYFSIQIVKILNDHPVSLVDVKQCTDNDTSI